MRQIEWAKTMSFEQIASATKVIRRLSNALHISFLVIFLGASPTQLKLGNWEVICLMLEWIWPAGEVGLMFEELMASSKQSNATTVALHNDKLSKTLMSS